MKLKWWYLLIPGLLLMIWAAKSPVLDYIIAIALSAIGGLLVIASAVLLVKERNAQAQAAEKQKQRKAEAARREAEANKAAAIKDREDRQARQAEWERTHGKIYTNLAGVTFKNNDGTSRQAALKDAYANAGAGILEFEEYEYRGQSALLVVYEGIGIGNIPKSRVSEVSAILDKLLTARLDVEVFTPDDDDEEKPEKIYRADLTLIYDKTAPD